MTPPFVSRRRATAALGVLLVLSLGVSMAAAVLLGRELDRARAAAGAQLHAACRVCMGPTWGEPDEPQPTAADFERCCPEYPGPVLFDCQWEIGRACRLTSLSPQALCEEAAAALCVRLFPLTPWEHAEGLSCTDPSAGPCAM